MAQAIKSKAYFMEIKASKVWWAFVFIDWCSFKGKLNGHINCF